MTPHHATPMPNQSPTPPRNLWPISIVAFFTVAIAGCVSFVIFCSLHPTDLVSADYYEQEVRYQTQLDKIQRTQYLAGQASVAFNPGQKLITIQLPTEHLNSLTDGTVHLYRPSASRLDQQLILKPDATGAHTIDASQLAPGLWKVRVAWAAGGQGYFLDQKLEI